MPAGLAKDFALADAAGLGAGFGAALATGLLAGLLDALLAGLAAGFALGLAAGLADALVTGFFTVFGATFLLGFVVAFALAEDFFAGGFALLAGFFAAGRAGLARLLADALDTGLRVMAMGLPTQNPVHREPVENADLHPRPSAGLIQLLERKSAPITQKTPRVTRKAVMASGIHQHFNGKSTPKCLRACRDWGSTAPACRACPSNHPHPRALRPCG